jgi:hypothetical protein
MPAVVVPLQRGALEARRFGPIRADFDEQMLHLLSGDGSSFCRNISFRAAACLQCCYKRALGTTGWEASRAPSPSVGREDDMRMAARCYLLTGCASLVRSRSAWFTSVAPADTSATSGGMSALWLPAGSPA